MVLLLAFGLSILAAGAANAATQEIDAFRYATDAEARAQWTPMYGTAPVSVLTAPLAGRKGLKLPCDLTGSLARAAWDRKVSLDLSEADRFTFRFYVDDPAKVGYCSLYFESGDGWYAAGFAPVKGWSEVSLDKARFNIEGHPAGWGKVETIRLSVWKSLPALTFAAIADLEAVSSQTVVVLGDRTPADSPEWDTVDKNARFVATLLKDAGVDAGTLTDTDVESGALAGRKVAVFPYNPNITEKEVDEIERFVAGGGHVVACYQIPSRLYQVLGFRYKEHRRQTREGDFAAIRLTARPEEGFPKSVGQASWNVNVAEPAGKNARVIGEWLAADGNPSGAAALLVSDAGAFFGHIFLADDLPGKRRLLLALVARHNPELWARAAARAVAGATSVGDCETLSQLKSLVSTSGRPEAKAALSAAVKALGDAKAAEGDKRYPSAIAKAEKAREAFATAYCASAPAKAGEIRAVWCHSAAGVSGKTWDETIKGLAAAGIDRVLPNMLWGGRAFYKSALLPVDGSVAKDGDQIAECVAAGRKHGVQVHVWKVNWNLGNAPEAFLSKMRTERRTQKDPQGGDIDWLCPSNPLNFALERDSMLEVVRNYDVAGLHFDYIRYPDSSGCYCDGCRERFEKQFAVRVDRWPAEVVSGPLKPKYLEFRRSNITRLVKAVSDEARRIRPGIQISAAVFSDWPQCSDGVGQDWIKWVREGYVDFVCPMNYTDSAARLDGLVTAQVTATGRAKPLLAGIGVTLGEWTLTPDQVVRQILVTRKRGADGFTLFNLDRFVLEKILPALKAGVTRPVSRART